jgi:chemotaxis protein CheD
MADYVVTNNSGVLITTVGSCVAIGIYDGKGVGGLAHIMLPEHDGKSELKGKFADTAIPAMIQEMRRMNADISNIRAKIAGGAQMFNFPSFSLSIGERNIQKVREVLKKNGIKIVGEEVGKNYGRTVEFYTLTGKMIVRTSDKIIAEL